MQGQYGAATDKGLKEIVSKMWTTGDYERVLVAPEIPAYSQWVLYRYHLGGKLYILETSHAVPWLAYYPLGLIK
ncbi:hypothetical protein BDQ17DRAFT_1031335 [Cyathus striatus]|nr:hypothetical protein BDQ17DRAFT_1031335 [Cyathus striatus]